MVMDLAPIPPCPGRWGWWLDAMESCGLPGPIPALDFGSVAGSREAQKNLTAAADRLGQELCSVSTPAMLIHWLAWGLGVSEDAPKLKPEAEEWLYRHVNLDLWREAPADYLGWLICEYRGRGQDQTGFYPTPMNVCQMMASMAFAGPGQADPFAAVHEPCVGTGRLLLAASGYSIRLSGQDVNPTCVMATLVNGAVYAPWLSFPLPRMKGEGDDEPLVVKPVTAYNEAGQGLLFGEVA